MPSDVPEEKKRPLTILGVGNVLCSDDGLGPTVVSALAEIYEGEGVSLVDGGTLGLSLLPIIEDSARLILVDAVQLDKPAGTLVTLMDEDVIPAVRMRLSPHQVGVADLLDAGRLLGKLPEKVILLGVVPESIELGYALSEPVCEAIPDLIDAIFDCARELGFPLHMRADRTPDPSEHRNHGFVLA